MCVGGGVTTRLIANSVNAILFVWVTLQFDETKMHGGKKDTVLGGGDIDSLSTTNNNNNNNNNIVYYGMIDVR